MATRTKRITHTDPLAVLGEALESAAETFSEATADARASAKVAARKAEKVVHSGLYRGSYWISYGLVFGAVFINELLPEGNVLRRGFEEGAEAGLLAAAGKRTRPKAAARPAKRKAAPRAA